MKQAEPLIPVFGEDCIRKLFSKKWQNRISAIEEIERATFSEPDRHFSSALEAMAAALNDKIAAVAQKAMSAFENLIQNCSGVDPNSHHLKTNLDLVMIEIMERIGDNNKAVKDKASDICKTILNSEYGGP